MEAADGNNIQTVKEEKKEKKADPVVPADEEAAVSVEKTDCGEERNALPEDLSLEALWHRIFEDGESFKTSFNLIRSGTSLEAITEKEFIVSASSSLKLRYLKENAATLEDLMEKHTGVRRRLRCAEQTDEAIKQETDIDAIRAMAEEALGIKVEIE